MALYHVAHGGSVMTDKEMDRMLDEIFRKVFGSDW